MAESWTYVAPEAAASATYISPPVSASSSRHGSLSSRKSSGSSGSLRPEVSYVIAPVICESPTHWSSSSSSKNSLRRRDPYEREPTYDNQVAVPPSPGAQVHYSQTRYTFAGRRCPKLPPIESEPNVNEPPNASPSSGYKEGQPLPSPEVPDLTGRVWKTRESAVAAGGFSDIYVGQAVRWGSNQQEAVAIKVLRIVGMLDDRLIAKLNRRMNREMEHWRRLVHPHVLPLYGICRNPGWEVNAPALVAPWMENGDAEVYVNRNPHILRLPIVVDVAMGMAYIHSLRIVHGDLKGKNVLINSQGRAQIADFGLSRAIRETTSSLPGGSLDDSSTWGGSLRWMAPELHDEMLPLVTEDSDIYAFGSTALQILSGRVPFHYFRQDFEVVTRIRKGEYPTRPEPRDCPEMVDNVWTLLVSCWTREPLLRLRMAQISTRLFMV